MSGLNIWVWDKYLAWIRNQAPLFSAKKLVLTN